VKISPGNFVLAVNGKELKTTENYWSCSIFFRGASSSSW